jgi:RNA polymerase sigma factor (sigma-70 family)
VREDDDPALVRRCRDGERSAFEQLVVRYQKPVYNAALRMLHEPQDAMDVAQTTFLKAFEHLADYDPSFKFYSWIYRIASTNPSMPSAHASPWRRSTARSHTRRRVRTCGSRVSRPAARSGMH